MFFVILIRSNDTNCPHGFETIGPSRYQEMMEAVFLNIGRDVVAIGGTAD